MWPFGSAGRRFFMQTSIQRNTNGKIWHSNCQQRQAGLLAARCRHIVLVQTPLSRHGVRVGIEGFNIEYFWANSGEFIKIEITYLGGGVKRQEKIVKFKIEDFLKATFWAPHNRRNHTQCVLYEMMASYKKFIYFTFRNKKFGIIRLWSKFSLIIKPHPGVGTTKHSC